MPVALEDGPLGIEALHEWFSIDPFTLLYRLGDIDQDPHLRIKNVSGLSGWDVDDVGEPKTEAVGELDYPTRARGKNVTYEVEVRGSTLQLMRRGAAAAAAAFGPDASTGLVAVRQMMITPNASYGSAQHAYRGKCLQFVPGGDEQDTGPNSVVMKSDGTYHSMPYKRAIVIGVKLHDPRIYEWDPESEFGFVNPKW